MTIGRSATPRRAASDRRQVLFDLVPLGLVIVAEGTWIAVVGWLVQEYTLRPQVLGIPEMTGFVAAGVVAARLLAPKTGAAWPRVALATVAFGGAIGWLLAPEARAALATDPLAALAAHPGGWVAALAVLRGFAHAALPLADGSIGRLLSIGVPGLAIAGLMGGLIREPFRTEFLDRALVAAILFVATATPALALARINAIGRTAGFDWRRNPIWAAAVVLLVALALAVAPALAGVAGSVLELLFAIALLPMLLLGLMAGFDRTGKRVLGFTAAVALLILVLNRIIPALPPGGEASGGSTAGDLPDPSTGDQVVAIGVGGLLLAVLVATILVLAAAWMRRQRPDEDDDVFETRTIDRNVGPTPPRRRRRGWQRSTTPTDAVAAYEALLRDLDGHAAVRRLSWETPAQHAGRLRSVATGAAPADLLRLDLLAADYNLDRFGGVGLADREHRRAVERWRRLRRRLPRARD